MLVDASELLHFTRFAPDACLIVLSRSGKSVEVVNLLDKAGRAGCQVVGITNTPDSPLGHKAKVVLPLKAAFDHNVSVTMYSALTLIGGLLATEATSGITPSLGQALHNMLDAAQKLLGSWQTRIADSEWLKRVALPTYFLARGSSLAGCHAARLVWEEAAKVAATAMTTGGFRHGPQEILAGSGARIGIWLSPSTLREQDLRLAKDLSGRDVPVMLIGQNLTANAAKLTLETPALAPEYSHWQFLVDVIPAQLASEVLARHRGADCDSFLFCPYIIEAEGGL